MQNLQIKEQIKTKNPIPFKTLNGRDALILAQVVTDDNRFGYLAQDCASGSKFLLPQGLGIKWNGDSTFCMNY